MNQKIPLKDSLRYAFKQMAPRERFTWILQCVLFVVIVIFALLGVYTAMPIDITNTIDMILLILLLLISGFRLTPKRLVYAIVYYTLAFLTFVILIASFII